jgi:hypothetical protein
MFGRKRGIYSMIGAAAEAAAATLFAPFDWTASGPGGYGRYAKDENDTTGGGGGNDTVTGGGGGDDDPPPVPTVPKSEADKAFRARDEAKKSFKAMIALLGYDPQHTKLTETGDPDNPYKVEVDGEDVTEELKGKRKGKKDNSADELTKAEQKYKNRLAAANEAATKRESGLIRIIDQLAVLSPLRAALQANDAVDSGGPAGEYTDVVELARKSLRTTVNRDDDGQIALDDEGNAAVTVTPMNPDGTPMVDAAGKAVSINEFVKKFLEKRPVFKKNRRPGGPGAGASHVPAGGRASVTSGAREAGFSLFGLKPPGSNGQ